MAPRVCNYTLTDKRIQAAKPKAKPYPLADAGGLYADVLTSGSKVWSYSYGTSRLHEIVLPAARNSD